MKFLSKDLYRSLKSELGPALRSLGFKQAKSGMAAWTQQFDEQHLTFWFQCDKWGWEPDWGSSFTLEFQLGSSSEPGTGNVSQRQRYCSMLADAEREGLRQINNQIIKSLPGSKKGLARVMSVMGIPVPGVGVLPHAKPYAAGADIWMHYYSQTDVSRWTEFLSPKLSSLLAQLQQPNISR